MDILKDEAIVLKRKFYNEDNIFVSIFSKEYGKVTCLAYGIRKSKKKELYALNPTNYISFEINKKGINSILKDFYLLENFSKIYSSIEKVQISIYIVYVLDKVLEYTQCEEDLYEDIKKIYKFLNEVDNKFFLDQEYQDKFLYRFLKRLCLDLGIYDDSIIKNISVAREKVKIFEKYLSAYFDIEIDYNKIIKRSIYEKN